MLILTAAMQIVQPVSNLSSVFRTILEHGITQIHSF